MTQQKSDCPACRLVRVFLLLAVPIMMMMWFKPELPLLKSINLTYTFANLVGFACVSVIAYKAYHEFWLPARKAKLSAVKKAPSAIQTETLEASEPRSGIQPDMKADMGVKSNVEAETETETETKIKEN